jgi:hypothetical protein
MLGTIKARTTPYHPKSDGMVERFNQTLETMLSAYVSDNHKDWDRQLPYVMMAYRATAHETTGFSPNMKYNPGELIGDISDDGDNYNDDKHEKPKSSDKTDLKGTREHNGSRAHQDLLQHLSKGNWMFRLIQG